MNEPPIHAMNKTVDMLYVCMQCSIITEMQQPVQIRKRDSSPETCEFLASSYAPMSPNQYPVDNNSGIERRKEERIRDYDACMRRLLDAVVATNKNMMLVFHHKD
mmetsp:Transcript_25344/g.42109  ORF Transcript_25344/g.42109 Transcript_25344/m.42109 type:complete len:105 (+) Transcript_25344:228-542(+)